MALLLAIASAAGSRAAARADNAPMDALLSEPNLRGSLRSIGEVELLRMKREREIDRRGTDVDLDLIEYATLEAKNLGDPRVRAFFSARAEVNPLRPPAASELRDLSDAEPARRHVKLFDAYVEARDLAAGHLMLRAGRQSIDGFDPVSIDGGRIDFPNLGFFRAMAYGGMRATVYSETDDRPVFGGEIGARLPFGLDLLAGASHDLADTFGVEAQEELFSDLSFGARLRAIGGRLSEARARARGRLPAAAIEIRIEYVRWFETERFPYDSTFERNRPRGIDRLHVSARTDGNELVAEAIFDPIPHAVLSLRGRIFRPIGKKSRDPYNLSSEEIAPRIEVFDFPWPGLEAGFGFRTYRADTGVSRDLDPGTVEGFTDLGGEGVSRADEVEIDLGQRFGRALLVEAGGVFRRQNYTDRFGKIEGAKGWDAHAKLVWLASGSWTISFRYDFARDLDLFAPNVDWDQRVRIEVGYAF
jgi:hypothetical protein